MKHLLGWLNETNHLYYEIYDNVDSSLSKQEFVAIAENVLDEQ
ncbi:hypothetical protein [Paenibacillus cellulosilyticus]|nr:hypothetical protein [Paenibacillus cellulosilyticus]